MKTKFLVLLLVLLTNSCLCVDSIWNMTVKNELGTDDPIILKRGVFTKVTFIITHADGEDLLDNSYDISDFIVTLDDKNIKTIENEYHIIPSTSLEYTTYIGLRCDSQLETDYQFSFKLKEVKYLMETDKKDSNLNIAQTSIKIDNSPISVEIYPISEEIPQKSYRLFKIKNEIYNMDSIKIKKDEIVGENKLFEFKEIEIKSFAERSIFDENEIDNHGILFDFPFGTSHSYAEFGNDTNTTFTLKVDADKCQFNLVQNTFTISVTEKEQSKLTNVEKDAIIVNTENITPKKDESINIQLETYIPSDSVIIECELSNDLSGENIKYNNYVSESGKFIIRFDDLVAVSEYKAKCKFTTLTHDKSSFEITIGNFEGADVITPLIPSRKFNRTPQCAEFIFNSEQKIKEFGSLAEKFCKKIMTKDEKILSRIMGSIDCKEIKKIEDKELNKFNKSMICVGLTPSIKSKKFRESLVKEDISYFDDHFNKFVSELNSTEKIKNLFKLDKIDLKEINRYDDKIAPDVEKIILEVDTENGMKNRNKLKFKITSKNSQPIECYYNQKLKKEDKKKFIDLKGGNSVVLNGESDTKIIEVSLSDQKKNDMFSLYLICYNLPGYNIRYESTGIFNAYTYLYTDSIEKQEVHKKEKVTINCAEKNNKINPHCMKDKKDKLDLKTKIPENIEGLDDEVEKIDELSDEAQSLVISEKNKEIKEEIEKIKGKKKEILEKMVKLAKYLSKRDCSRYSKGNTNELSEIIENKKYKECRNNKKEIQSKLISLLKDNLNCANLKENIANGISDNSEQNIKLILLLINELSKNADSFKEGESQILYDLTMCIPENFETYWSLVEKTKKDKGDLKKTISVIKKDISHLIIKSLVNLIKVLHFDEIDDYLDNRNITKAGIMGRKNGMRLHKGIFNFLKNLNEFGNKTYNISDSIEVEVITNDEYVEENQNLRLLKEEGEIVDDLKETNFSDKGIVLILHPKYMMSTRNAYSMQIVSYDSPLMPIKTSGDEDDSTVDTFISVTLYDNKGNEVKVDDLPENVRPKILYNRSYHRFIKKCFYFNEATQDLDESGMSINEKYKHKDKVYFACSSKHLTSFTAGNYYTPGLRWWQILLIILGVLIVLAGAFVVYVTINKKKANSEDIVNAQFGKNKNNEIMEV